MKNLFKRNKIYYYRVVIPTTLKDFFKQNHLYIKSLNTSNKNEAILLRNYLNVMLNYIKAQCMLLKGNELKQIIDEFKATNLNAIQNRNKSLAIEEIDELIHYYEHNDVKHDDKSLISETKDLSTIFIEKDLDPIFDMDTTDVDYLVNQIVKIKLSVLHDLKNNLNKTTTSNNVLVNTVTTNINDKNIQECKELFLSVHDKGLKTYERYITSFVAYCNSMKIYTLNFRT